MATEKGFMAAPVDELGLLTDIFHNRSYPKVMKDNRNINNEIRVTVKLHPATVLYVSDCSLLGRMTLSLTRWVSISTSVTSFKASIN